MDRWDKIGVYWKEHLTVLVYVESYQDVHKRKYVKDLCHGENREDILVMMPASMYNSFSLLVNDCILDVSC